MFDEISFDKIKRLPTYVFAAINEIKLAMRQQGLDVIDFSMGNPDGPTPTHIIDKLCEAARKPKNHGYSVSKGILKLRMAICDWYARKYGINLNPNTQACVTMGSKEGYVHLVQAITNPGDMAIVPDPAYPIHYYAFILSGANVARLALTWNEDSSLCYEDFFRNLTRVLRESIPKPKFVVVNFPHNPTATIVYKDFYQQLITMAKKERFYIISDIAYADLSFDDYKTPSIFEAEGALDVAVETYTLSKSYNMAGWRVGFVVGNEKIIEALQKIKSWLDYGIYTPMQVAATIALNSSQQCVADITSNYKHRMEALISAFHDAGWDVRASKASMFLWTKLPTQCAHLTSMEFSTRLLQEAHVALSPGIGFGEHGEGYVRIALIENQQRIRQAAKNIRTFLKQF